MTVTLRNKDGQVVRDEFVQLTLTVDGDAKFDSSLVDESADQPGMQVTVTSGVLHVGIVTSNTAGTLTLNVAQAGFAAADKSTRKASLAIKPVDNAALTLHSSTVGVVANGTNIIDVDVTAQDGSG